MQQLCTMGCLEHLRFFRICRGIKQSVPTFAHEFCYNVDGLLRHHSIERHQFVMSEFLHDLSLLQEGLWGHCARLQGLNCHLSSAIPCA